MVITPQEYGSADTILKQQIILKYLTGYLRVMKNQRKRFSLSYVDAFAGSGLWQRPGAKGSTPGVALSVLRMDAAFRFDRYVFGDIKRRNIASLHAAIQADREAGKELPPIEAIRVVRQDANQLIAEECSRLATRPLDRAVMFIDPFGMALDWASVERVAASGKIDLWLLIPTGMGPGRMMTSRPMPASWRSRLNRFWGGADWEEHFLPPRHDLFGNAPPERDADVARIAEFAIGRLRKTFGRPNVHPTGLPLEAGNGQLSFLLTFACANKSKPAYEAAIRIADNLLGTARRRRV